MGAGKQKRALEQTAQEQERYGKIFENLAKGQISEGEDRAALQRDIYNNILPVAMQLINSDYKSTASPFPDIQRPDFTGGIRRDYFDDQAAIQQDENQAVADANDYMTASGLTRSGAHGSAIGQIMRGADTARTGARRNMQSRLEGEARDAYADTRDLALQKHADTRAVEGTDTGQKIAGANILAGQQGVFNPATFQALGGSSYGQGLNSQVAAGNSRYQAGSLPGMWSTLGGIAGGVVGSAAGAGGLSKLWK